MNTYNQILDQLHSNLNTLSEREAKYGLDVPVALLNQIADHKQAIALTKQAISGELSEAQWREALKPLLVAIEQRTGPDIALNISDINNSVLTIGGSVMSNVQAGGDVVGGDKVTHNYYYGPIETKAPEKPRQSFEPALIEIPGGPFILGSDDGLPYEGPAHTVNLPTFYIGQYPLTNLQFAAFIDDTGKVVPLLGWPGQRPAPEQENLPVTGVTWYLAMEYCAWLSQQSGRSYALPTEAEWEKAARGPEGRHYPWGNTWQPNRANNEPNHLTPVNYYPAQSVCGGYDWVGNAREWTCSLWGSNRQEPDGEFLYDPQKSYDDWSPDSPRNSLTAGKQTRRVYRGGVFKTIETMCCSTRKANIPETTLNLNQYGFRVVMRLTSTS